MSLAGFDFSALNRRWLASDRHPVNMAGNYGVGISNINAGEKVWRCVGAYHLLPSENRGRHNLFVDVLDERGSRVNGAVVNWQWAGDAPIQTKVLDKPVNEPGCDIPIDKNVTIKVWVQTGGLLSDAVYNIHPRHADEPGPNGENWNSVGHHSFYVCFQRQASSTITPPIDPPVIDPPTIPGNAAALAQLDVVQRELDKLRGLLLS
jgi:hypothetical protein